MGPVASCGETGDVVCLGHGGDFEHFGDAAPSDEVGDDVGHDVVCELLVEDGSEVPAGDESLADADGHGDLVFDEFSGVVVFGRDGFFEPADVELAEGFAFATILQAPAKGRGGLSAYRILALNQHIRTYDPHHLECSCSLRG